MNRFYVFFYFQRSKNIELHDLFIYHFKCVLQMTLFDPFNRWHIPTARRQRERERESERRIHCVKHVPHGQFSKPSNCAHHTNHLSLNTILYAFNLMHRSKDPQKKGIIKKNNSWEKLLPIFRINKKNYVFIWKCCFFILFMGKSKLLHRINVWSNCYKYHYN